MADDLDRKTRQLVETVNNLNKGLGDQVKTIAERQKDDFQAALNARAFKKQVNAMLKDDSFVKMSNAMTEAEEAVRKTQNKLQETLDNDETLKQKRKFNVLLERQLQNMSLTEAERIEKVKAFNEHLQSINEREEVIRNQYNTLIEKQQAKHQQLSAEYEKEEERRIDNLKKLSDSGKFTTFSDSIKELSGGLLDIGGAFDDATKKFNAAKNLLGTLATPITWTGKKLFGLGKQVDDASDDLKKNTRLRKGNNRELATANTRMKLFNLSLLGGIAKFALMGAAIFGLVKFLNNKFGLFEKENVDKTQDVSSVIGGSTLAMSKTIEESDAERKAREQKLKDAEKQKLKAEKGLRLEEERLKTTRNASQRATLEESIEKRRLAIKEADEVIEANKDAKRGVVEKTVKAVPKSLLKLFAKGVTGIAVVATGKEILDNLSERDQNMETLTNLYYGGALTDAQYNEAQEIIMSKAAAQNVSTLAEGASAVSAAYVTYKAVATRMSPYVLRGGVKGAIVGGATALGASLITGLLVAAGFNFAEKADWLRMIYDPENTLAQYGILPDAEGYQEFLKNNAKLRETWEKSLAMSPEGKMMYRALKDGETPASLGIVGTDKGGRYKFGKGVLMTNKDLYNQVTEPLMPNTDSFSVLSQVDNIKKMNEMLKPDPGTLEEFQKQMAIDLRNARPGIGAEEIKRYVEENSQAEYMARKNEYEKGRNPVNIINSAQQNSQINFGSGIDTNSRLNTVDLLDGTLSTRLSLP